MVVVGQLQFQPYPEVVLGIYSNARNLIEVGDDTVSKPAEKKKHFDLLVMLIFDLKL